MFKIGYRTDAPPFSYNSAIGEPAGYIVDLCREVAAAAKQELGVKDLKVEYVTVTAEDRFDAVKSGRVDLCARRRPSPWRGASSSTSRS